jgi:hypothetical protein
LYFVPLSEVGSYQLLNFVVNKFFQPLDFQYISVFKLFFNFKKM